MGEITFIALTSDTVPPMELRRLSETVGAAEPPRHPGVSQVVPIGGDVREYLVEMDPAAMVQYRISVEGVVAALEKASATPAAASTSTRARSTSSGTRRARSTSELESTVVRVENGVPLRLRQVARVSLAPEPHGHRGLSGATGGRAQRQKQPDANNPRAHATLDRVLAQVEKTLPKGVVIEKENFRQADFIDVAIHNVSVALRDGAILVLIVLFLFLGNLRAT
jgi:Cu/Ag efflux pump CusA